MARIKEGDICIVDPYNTLGNKAHSISSVIVLKLVKPAFLSSNNLWNCCVNYYGTTPVTDFQGHNQINEDYCMNIQEKLLYPVNGLDQAIILRYPDDAPEFTDKDLDTVRFAMEVLTNVVSDVDEETSKDVYKKLKQLKTLSIKMNYYLRRREV